VLAVDDRVREKPLNVRTDTTEEVQWTENSRPLQLNELRSLIDASRKPLSRHLRGRDCVVKQSLDMSST
jgi:hypothetical protein